MAHLKPYKSSPPEFGERPSVSIRKRKETSYEDWEVVEITAEKYKSSKNRTKLYKAIWKINEVEQETDEWIPAANFKNAPAVLAKWKNTLKLEPKRWAR